MPRAMSVRFEPPPTGHAFAWEAALHRAKEPADEWVVACIAEPLPQLGDVEHVIERAITQAPQQLVVVRARVEGRNSHLPTELVRQRPPSIVLAKPDRLEGPVIQRLVAYPITVAPTGRRRCHNKASHVTAADLGRPEPLHQISYVRPRVHLDTVPDR